MLLDFLFFVFAAVAVIAASMVIVAKNPVQSVLFLVLTFVATAGTWLLIEAEFLAIALILIYVGAVLVLFMFVVMMLDIEVATLRARFIKHLPLGMCIVVLMAIVLMFSLGKQNFGGGEIINSSFSDTSSNVRELGAKLFNMYLFEVEVAGLLLFAAMIAAISLTFRGSRSRKSQEVAKQVRANKQQRLNIINMQAENNSKGSGD